MSEQAIRVAIIAAQHVYGADNKTWAVWARDWLCGVKLARQATACFTAAEATEADLDATRDKDPRAHAAAMAAFVAASAAAHWALTQFAVRHAVELARKATADNDTINTLWEVVK